MQGYANWQGEIELIVDMDGFHINCNHPEKDLSALVDSAGGISAQFPVIVKTKNQMRGFVSARVIKNNAENTISVSNIAFNKTKTWERQNIGNLKSPESIDIN